MTCIGAQIINIHLGKNLIKKSGTQWQALELV